jgi:hypothetical protein
MTNQDGEQEDYKRTIEIKFIKQARKDNYGANNTVHQDKK